MSGKGKNKRPAVDNPFDSDNDEGDDVPLSVLKRKAQERKASKEGVVNVVEEVPLDLDSTLKSVSPELTIEKTLLPTPAPGAGGSGSNLAALTRSSTEEIEKELVSPMLDMLRIITKRDTSRESAFDDIVAKVNDAAPVGESAPKNAETVASGSKGKGKGKALDDTVEDTGAKDIKKKPARRSGKEPMVDPLLCFDDVNPEVDVDMERKYRLDKKGHVQPVQVVTHILTMLSLLMTSHETSIPIADLVEAGLCLLDSRAEREMQKRGSPMKLKVQYRAGPSGRYHQAEQEKELPLTRVRYVGDNLPIDMNAFPKSSRDRIRTFILEAKAMTAKTRSEEKDRARQAEKEKKLRKIEEKKAALVKRKGAKAFVDEEAKG
jgi:hypothetical protein